MSRFPLLPLVLVASAFACAEAPPPLPPPTPVASATAPADTGPAVAPTLPGPPATPVRPVVTEYHGTKVTDDYQWLEKSADPEAAAWIAAQSAYARRALDALPDRQALRARVRELLGATSANRFAMQSRGDLLFALVDQPPLQQPFLVTLKSAASLEGEHRVIDPNKIDPSGSTAIDFYVPSRDGHLVAVSLSQKGSENGTLHVYETATGKEIGDTIAHVNGGTAGGSVAWAADGKGLYYTRYPRPGERPPADVDFYQQVYFHKLGTTEKDDTYALGKDFPRIAQTELRSSDDGKHVLASVEDGDGGEFAHFLLHAGKWEKIAGFKEGIKEAHFGRDGSLYLLSVAGAPRGKLLRLAPGVAALAKAKVVVPEGDGVIKGFTATRTRLFVSFLLGGPSEMRAFDLDGQKGEPVAIPPVSAVREMVAAGDTLLFRDNGYLEPSAWYAVGSKQKEAVKTAIFQTSPASFADAEVVRETCTSRDGTKVPLQIVRRKGTPLDRKSPTLLTGYGGFGISRVPRFDPASRLWLDRGGIVAYSNLRGGGEYGEEWHRAGALTRKQNVFDDFTACAARLVEAGYTSPEHLAITGGSNGGLLMGAALTQHPEMFRAVISHVGIYDMLRVELTPNGAFNVTEYGTVKDPEQFQALHAYSPYHHVKAGVAYPATLLLTGANDPRVDPFHSRKMIAALQARGAGGRPLLLRVSGDTGHGIGTPLDAEIEEVADVYGFLFQELGMSK